MLAATGYWPPDIPFDVEDLTTTVGILNESRK